MKKTLKCLICKRPMIVGKKLHAKYTCPSCKKQYLIKQDGGLDIEGQV